MHPAAIGPFKIERELGRGGMGVVYLAIDTRLDRQVAIKALPADLAADPDRLARFQREAKVLASLNHPNIGGIHGLESADGHQYLVLEFIEGETLADRLASGPIPVEEALTIAKQIAEALETAHEKAVIHRDLKPGNVMVTPDGVVKVLDFGLARTAEGAPSSINATVKPDSPTVPVPVRHSPTIPGAIMGTAGYMSPEQARGKPVDKRSDIFSFGCVLYEMLTGAGPFPGETVTDSLGAILHREPNWSLIPPTAPPRVRELLTHCLAKDRKERLHDIGDARLELARAVSGREWNSTLSVPAAGSGRRVPLLICLAGAAGLGVAGWFAGSRLGAAPVAPPRGIKLELPTKGLAFGQAAWPVISPDGQRVVFSAQPATGDSRCLFVRDIDSFDARPIPDTGTASGNGYAVDTYFWSPDSRSIGFVDDGKLFSVELAGGARRLIAAAQYCQGAVWAHDGTIVVNTFGGGELSGQIERVRAEGGTLETLVKAEPKQLLSGLTLLPDGQGFLYFTGNFEPEKTVRMGRLMAWKTGSPKPTLVCELSSQAWYVKPGWLIYVSDGTIKAAPFDLASLKMTGEAVTVADDAWFFKPTGSTSLSVSTDGTMAYSCPTRKSRTVWFGADGTRQEPFPTQANLSSVEIAPSGSSIAATVNDVRTGNSDVWVYGITRPTATRLTTDPRFEGHPVWSRDGSIIYFSADWKDYPAVYSIRPDGSGQAQSVYDGAGTGSLWWSRSIAPDGKTLMVSGWVDKLGSELRVLPLDSAGAPVPPAAAFRSSPANEAEGRFSPDGKWVAYTCDESGRGEIYIAPYPQSAAGPKVQISSGGGSASRWSPSGDKLYYVDSAPRQVEGSTRKLMVVDLATPAAFASPPAPKVLIEVSEDILDYDVTPDGKRILVVLMPSDQPPMRVIVNGLPR